MPEQEVKDADPTAKLLVNDWKNAEVIGYADELPPWASSPILSKERVDPALLDSPKINASVPDRDVEVAPLYGLSVNRNDPLYKSILQDRFLRVKDKSKPAEDVMVDGKLYSDILLERVSSGEITDKEFEQEIRRLYPKTTEEQILEVLAVRAFSAGYVDIDKFKEEHPEQYKLVSFMFMKPVDIEEMNDRFIRWPEKIPVIGIGATLISSGELTGALRYLKKANAEFTALDKEEEALKVALSGQKVTGYLWATGDVNKYEKDIRTSIEEKRQEQRLLMAPFVAKIKAAQELRAELDIRGMTGRAKVLDAGSGLASFMTEFALTGGFSQFGKEIIKAGVKKALAASVKAGLKEGVKGAITRTAIKTMARLAGGLTEGIVRSFSAVGLARVTADASERWLPRWVEVGDKGELNVLVPGDTFVNGFLKAWGNVAISYTTELMGGDLSRTLRGVLSKTPAVGHFVKRFSTFLGSKYGSKAGVVQAFRKHFGWHGMIGEWLEEDAEGFVRAVVDLEGTDQPIVDRLVSFAKENWDPENMAIRATVLAIPGMLTVGSQAIAESHTKSVLGNEVQAGIKRVMAQAERGAMSASEFADAFRSAVMRASDMLGFLGPAGKRLQSDLFQVAKRAATNIAESRHQIGLILKEFSKEQMVTITQLADNAISPKGISDKLVMAAAALKHQLDILQKEAMAVGMRKGELTGRAWPQIVNKAGEEFLAEAEKLGKASHSVFAWAQQQVNEGKFKDVDTAIVALVNYRKRSERKQIGYLEGERTVHLNLEHREWNPDKVLSHILDSGWHSIEASRQWGVMGNVFPSAQIQIERISDEFGTDMAKRVRAYLDAQFGETDATRFSIKWNRRLRKYQFTTKVAISPVSLLRNMCDRLHKGFTIAPIWTNIRATIMYPPFINRWIESSRKLESDLVRMGAVIGHGVISDGLEWGTRIGEMMASAFAISERGNQTYIALVRHLQLTEDVKRLQNMSGPDKHINALYDRVLSIVGKSFGQTKRRIEYDARHLTKEQFLDLITSPKIPDDIMAELLFRTVHDSTFPLTLASRRMWWGVSPVMQTMAQFKTWGADQIRFMYLDCLKEAIVTRDPSRLARSILGLWFSGELYSLLKDLLYSTAKSTIGTATDKDKSLMDTLIAAIRSIREGGGVGLMWDLTYGAVDWAIGPTANTAKNIARSLIQGWQDPSGYLEAAKGFVIDEVTAVRQARSLADKIDQITDKENITEHYLTLRSKAFDWQKEHKNDYSEFDELLKRTVLGRPWPAITNRTQSLKSIARQILVGDIDDAADHMVKLFEATEPEDWIALKQALHQSQRNHSPAGNMAIKDMREFYKSLSPDTQAIFRHDTSIWIDNYDKALAKAGQKLKAKGMFDELRKQIEELRQEAKRINDDGQE